MKAFCGVCYGMMMFALSVIMGYGAYSGDYCGRSEVGSFFVAVGSIVVFIISVVITTVSIFDDH